MASACCTTSSYDQRSKAASIDSRSRSRNKGLTSVSKLTGSLASGGTVAPFCSSARQGSHQRGYVVLIVHDAVDEQGRGAAHFTRGDSALDVPPNPPQDLRAESIMVEARDVQLELRGICVKVGVTQRLLAVEEQLVHLPEPALKCGCLGCGRRREGVRVDLHEREVPEREADSTAHFLLDAFDRSK